MFTCTLPFMRSHRRDDESNRESVFERPAHLDALVASVAAGAATVVDEYEGDSYDTRYGSRDSHESSYEMHAAALEEAEREAEVSRLQNDHLTRQLKGAVAELELHKRHAREFKAMLEIAEADLSAAHEHSSDLSHKLKLAQEGNRRNAECASQLLTHLNTARVDLKAQTTKNEQLMLELAKARQGSSSSKSASGRSSEEVEDGCGPFPGALPASIARGLRASVGHELHDTPPLTLQRLATRTVLTPVTHDVGVQVDMSMSIAIATYICTPPYPSSPTPTPSPLTPFPHRSPITGHRSPSPSPLTLTPHPHPIPHPSPSPITHHPHPRSHPHPHSGHTRRGHVDVHLICMYVAGGRACCGARELKDGHCGDDCLAACTRARECARFG